MYVGAFATMRSINVNMSMVAMVAGFGIVRTSRESVATEWAATSGGFVWMSSPTHADDAHFNVWNNRVGVYLPIFAWYAIQAAMIHSDGVYGVPTHATERTHICLEFAPDIVEATNTDEVRC